MIIRDEYYLRNRVLLYASPIRNEVIENKEDLEKYILETSDALEKRKKGINLLNIANKLNGKKCKTTTIEFRCSSGSINPKVIQNLIRFFSGLLTSIQKDDPIVNYYIDKHFDNVDKLDFEKKEIYDNDGEINENKLLELNEEFFNIYEMIDLEKALELVDIVFDNNHDKICFLRQYIKDEEIEYQKKYIK